MHQAWFGRNIYWHVCSATGCLLLYHGPKNNVGMRRHTSEETGTKGCYHYRRCSSCDSVYALSVCMQCMLAITLQHTTTIELQSAKLPMLRHQSTGLGCLFDTPTFSPLDSPKSSQQWQQSCCGYDLQSGLSHHTKRTWSTPQSVRLNAAAPCA